MPFAKSSIAMKSFGLWTGRAIEDLWPEVVMRRSLTTSGRTTRSW